MKLASESLSPTGASWTVNFYTDRPWPPNAILKLASEVLWSISDGSSSIGAGMYSTDLSLAIMGSKSWSF